MAFGQPEFVKELNRLGVDVSRETLARLETYAGLLVKWQAKINLVGPATLPDLWRRHFLDSAQLLPLLPAAPGVLVDLGSGAGFPGLVLAIMSEWRVHLVDSDQRKCAFLRQVALDTGVNTRVAIHAQRFEAVAGYKAEIVTARACAPLEALLGYALPFLGENGRCLFLKGAQAEEELTAAEADWNMQVERRPSLTDPAGTILVIEQLKRRKRQ
ncbi:MAG: 16S rRNA (guanine(527)-N(7))-methyltransferase RsmG [Rhodospirillaceae bacterium]|jgi:16S rRNA (guanine527-N7)-methyltransferase|nr:16S rRNA (guanine(527)-N(7))-methyltransferase RsmG [Rhodospirillaceae bacterium]